MSNKENRQLTKNSSLPRARAIDLVTREMPDEVLVYDLKRHKAHCLNQTAALVWKHCDGRRTVADIARLIQQDISTPVDEGTVWLAVERLGKAHLLEERIIAPSGSPRLSRRDAIRRLGLGGAIALPMVISIVAPTAVSAQTCVVNGQTGSCTSSTVNNCCSGCCDSPGTNTCLVTGLGLLASCQESCQCTGAVNLGCVLGVCASL